MISKRQRLQLRKFEAYGFLKNLQFFEPFLYVYLYYAGFGLFEIGLLMSIRYLVVFLLEIPSGVFADRFGKKTELMICFIFYIASFILFFIGGTFIIFSFAMVLFGIGEAMRSGTHKAMIMDFLDHEQVLIPKSEVYGKTRSFSLLGSMISSLLGALFIIYAPNIRYLFLYAIIPYVLDILLISTYPSYMNERVELDKSFKNFVKQMKFTLTYTLSNKKVRSLVYSSSSYEAWFKSIKSYVQLIVVAFGIVVIRQSNLSSEEVIGVQLGVLYAVIYFLSSQATRNAHRLRKYVKEDTITTYMWIPSGILMLILGLYTENVYVVFAVFLVIYPLFNIRKPLMIGLLGEHIEPSKRASVLSVESQLTTVLVACLAPAIGFISDTYSVSFMFILLGSVILFFEVFKLMFNKQRG